MECQCQGLVHVAHLHMTPEGTKSYNSWTQAMTLQFPFISQPYTFFERGNDFSQNGKLDCLGWSFENSEVFFSDEGDDWW